MIQVAICEDQKEEVERLCAILKESFERYCEISIFFSAHGILKASKKQHFDIYILKVNMPEVLGIDIARMIRQNNDECIIIFLADTEDYAIYAYEVYAFQYLLNPVPTSYFVEVMKRAVDQIQRCVLSNNQLETPILVKSKGELVTVQREEIEYVEYASHHIVFYLKGQRVVTSSTIRESFNEYINAYLNLPFLMRCHASFLINMRAIEKINNMQIVLKNGACVPLSRKYYSLVKEAYLSFISNEFKGNL